MTIHIGLYPGTFDPLTLGHIDMIERASHICDQLIIGVAENSGKSPLFSLSQRLNFVQKQVDYIQQKEKDISDACVGSFFKRSIPIKIQRTNRYSLNPRVR